LRQRTVPNNRPLADIAVTRALHADPGYVLADLLAQAVAAGIDPATAAALLSG
jgi:hypothetical protein